VVAVGEREERLSREGLIAAGQAIRAANATFSPSPDAWVEAAEAGIRAYLASSPSPPENDQMNEEEFERWAKEIGLTDAQWLPVRYVVEREFERGKASPPDREQAVEKVKKVLRERTVAHPSVMAEWIVAALFGPVRGDES
jgi:hypothetical protein